MGLNKDNFSLRKTIKERLKIEGKGLHSGEDCRIIIHPENTGGRVIFKIGKEKVPCKLSHSFSKGNFTGVRGVSEYVITIEHLLSAFFSYGISDGVVEVVKGKELPDLDGCSRAFSLLIQEAGIVSMSKNADIFELRNEMEFSIGKTSYRASPSQEFEIRCIILFDIPSIGRQEYDFSLSKGNYLEDIAPAKTFASIRDIEKLKEEGKGRGGEISKVLIFSEDKLLNPEYLIFDDEPVRHKILDFMGDVYLLSPVIKARFEINSPGHKGNLLFLKNFIQ